MIDHSTVLSYIGELKYMYVIMSLIHHSHTSRVSMPGVGRSRVEGGSHEAPEILTQ